MKIKIAAHPVMILRYMYPFLFVLIVPLVRAAAQYIISGRRSNIYFSEVVLLLLITVFSFEKYRRFSLCVQNGMMIVRRGLFINCEAKISIQKIACVSISRNIIDRLFGSATFFISTDAGRGSKADFEIKISRRSATQIEKLFFSDQTYEQQLTKSGVAVLAAALSSVTAGVLIIVPIVIRAAGILRINISSIIISEIESGVKDIVGYLPWLLNIAAVVVLVGFLLSFLLFLIRYRRLTVYCSAKAVKTVCSGLVKRTVIINTDNIAAFDYQTPPLLYGFNKSILCAISGMYGESKIHRAILKFCDKAPYYKNAKRLQPQKRSLYRFIRWPLLAMGVLIIITGVLFAEFGRELSIIGFVALILCLPAAGKLLVNMWLYKNSCITGENKIKVRTSRGYTLNTVNIPFEKIAEIRIKSNFFAEKRGYFDVQLRPISKKGHFYGIKHIKISRILKFFPFL